MPFIVIQLTVNIVRAIMVKTVILFPVVIVLMITQV